ncbi:MAG: extracellular solute-binding protein [Clostridiales bacterium]|nr:extracellular solute-binding protein [Clostridiales bacterium]
MSDKRRVTSSLFVRITALLLLISMALSLCACSRNSGFDGKRFAETRHITVLVDSNVKNFVSDEESGFTVNNSKSAQYIHDAVLRDCNIDVTYVDSDDVYMSKGNSADISFMDSVSWINTYYKMDSVINIAPILEEYPDSFSDLKELLGEENLYSCTDDPSEVWFITPKNTEPDARVTFIRKDWLDKLGLDAPSTREELHDCLIAFRDNADVLLGDNADQMIPFFVDEDPSISAKPLFDSCLDTSIEDRYFYEHGYCRATQSGFMDGLAILNEWYHEELLPEDFENIRALTKESYEPIENGYVGAFCSKYDYLYANKDHSHIKALQENCGGEARYIAVNTFENKNGEYTSWQEDRLMEDGIKVFLPSTCSDPLACMVYLNWISSKANIAALQEYCYSRSSIDPYFFDRYLLTVSGLYPDGGLENNEDAMAARATALEVNLVHRGNKCVRYWPYYFKYVDTGLAETYPDSTKNFTSRVISSAEGTFDDVYEKEFNEYLERGAYMIYKLRDMEWEKVMVEGDMSPW